ncbi:MAG: protoheme IX farnesyltransferase [Candidatus Heimdallarchaeota archaeon]|nr:protoheme IX farnesyltransferase [Candidatus Heimdallarchaeota archaeon]MCK4971998.1 protoheme IX farnesyltransferase [Candidatus Heimdallarchaeota archaeon]
MSNPDQYSVITEEKVRTTNDRFLPLRLYLGLIKEKQTIVLVFTSVLAYLISAYPTISLSDCLWLLFSMLLAVSGTTLLNMYIDRDIDKKMERTKDRALPSGKISPLSVLGHGILYTVSGIVFAGIFLNITAMVIIFLGFFFDIVIYSMWLKRRTHFSIIFGGIAGGLPAIAGRVVFTGQVDLIGILMGIFILSWIPLHILTLALLPKTLEGYKNADVPMWPVVRSKKETIIVITISSLISSLTAIAISMLLNIYIVITIVVVFSGFIMIGLSIMNLINPTDKTTKLLFMSASMFMVIAFLLWFIGKVI